MSISPWLFIQHLNIFIFVFNIPKTAHNELVFRIWNYDLFSVHLHNNKIFKWISTKNENAFWRESQQLRNLFIEDYSTLISMHKLTLGYILYGQSKVGEFVDERNNDKIKIYTFNWMDHQSFSFISLQK